jgi:AraC-like DNA-binding protein
MPAQRLRAEFRDISELGRVAGFDLGFRQLDRGSRAIPADLVATTTMTVVHMQFAQAYHQLGTPPPAVRTFGIPVHGMQSWLGRSYDEGSILPFNLPNGLDGVSSNHFEAFTLSVTSDYLVDVSESFQVPIAAVLAEPSVEMEIRNSYSNRRFRQLLGALLDDDTVRLDAHYQDEIALALLHAAFADTELADTSTPAARSSALARALSFIDDHRNDAVNVRSLCTATDTPLRTMNRAFRERFGIGPKAYLLRQRLSRVRAALVAAPIDTVIADIANEHGFWHLGQFAKDYRTMFGELPSETRSSR